MATKSMIAQKGYTWWTKDWNSNEKVFELNLAQRGLYRELIDLAMINNNVVIIKLKIWARMFNSTEKELELTLEYLVASGVLKRKNKTCLTIPSCEKRLAFIRSGKKGGKRIGKRMGNQTETETETERKRTTNVVPKKESTKDKKETFARDNKNRFRAIRDCAHELNNLRSLKAMILRPEYAETFSDFKNENAKMMSFKFAMLDFNIHLESTSDTIKTTTDYARHLHSWLRKTRGIDQYNLFPWQKYVHSNSGVRIKIEGKWKLNDKNFKFK